MKVLIDLIEQAILIIIYQNIAKQEKGLKM